MLNSLSRFVLPSLRQVLKNKVFIVLNLLGLSFGLAISLLLIQYSFFEFSYDRFHENADRLYRVRYDNFRDGKPEISSAAAVPAVGKAMRDNFPGVEDYAWAYPRTNGFFHTNGRIFHETKFYMVTPGFLRIFSWNMINGGREALESPWSAVISRTTAMKFFGHMDVLGSVISLEDGTVYTIRGVMEDVPENSHLKFSILLSADKMHELFEKAHVESWTWYNFYTYILLREGCDPELFNQQFDEWLTDELSGLWKKNNLRQYFSLQPLEKIHLYSDLSRECEPGENGNNRQVIILCLVAISILIIAWINYINISGSMAWSRAKEVGFRQVLGAERKHIYILFAVEALMIHFLAACISLVIIELCLPVFSGLINREMDMSLLSGPVFWIALSALVLAGAGISGLYLSGILTRYRPVETIKGLPLKFKTGFILRRILVVSQFVVCTGLLTSAFFSYGQLNYLENISPGINIDNTLVIWGPGLADDSLYDEQYQKFKTDLSSLRSVTGVTGSDNIPGVEIYRSEKIRLPDESSGRIVYNMSMDEEFLSCYGLDLLAGRDFQPEKDSGMNTMILNNSAVELLGYSSPREAIGKQVIRAGKPYEIIGVIKDYYQMSAKEVPDALAFYFLPVNKTYISVKLKTEGAKQAMEDIRLCWNINFSPRPFEYFFLEDVFDQQYKTEKQISRTLNILAILATFIAIMGLVGLSVYAGRERTREIGIRKVNGANAGRIILELLREYFILVLTAILIAGPLSWLAVITWLNTYKDHIDIRLTVFLLADAIVILVSFSSLAMQTIRVARLNPSTSLRHRF